MPRYFRNVQVYDPKPQPPVVVGGIHQHGSLSISYFYSMLDTVLVAQSSWVLFCADAQYQPMGYALDREDSSVLPVGIYVVMSPGTLAVNVNKAHPLAEYQALDVSLTSDAHRPRTLSLNISGTTRTDGFRSRVRERDGRCCVTGDFVEGGNYHPFHASHIFPIAHRDVWDLLQLSQHIRDDAPERDQGPVSINSVQNGLLLRTDIHSRFDAYDFAINPDRGYRIVDFTEGGKFDGYVLWINQNVEPKYRPSDDLLREHFKQCVLANVKGAGEQKDDWADPEDDHDISDFSTWEQKTGDDKGPSRLELELAARLYNQETLLG
ncbi:uncharacterized protein LACBIDRAFT_305376 [Laccaria bicolor S238N-H82]|uniref:Predicted protein n=1 Tax=Laccaria bicolor (strain S238N-H82 / ATCC MYA-4686) TaxID=486041 RepID=B0CU31_LACBS|nr:uncharacterized protein LACBIDRAFT_305376 [Laccaria bicolor S238N-H82]EDR14023.1 predicted protein [Laccaria bicolor S238N-H82]|eukprot:XP_001874582.1 predicted protein [Laccaria bicolor S238N-H82]